MSAPGKTPSQPSASFCLASSSFGVISIATWQPIRGPDSDQRLMFTLLLALQPARTFDVAAIISGCVRSCFGFTPREMERSDGPKIDNHMMGWCSYFMATYYEERVCHSRTVQSSENLQIVQYRLTWCYRQKSRPVPAHRECCQCSWSPPLSRSSRTLSLSGSLPQAEAGDEAPSPWTPSDNTQETLSMSRHLVGPHDLRPSGG